MSGGDYTFLALDGGAWGRTALAIDIARALDQRGDRVRIVASSLTAPLARSTGLPVDEVPDKLGRLTRLYLESNLPAGRCRALILCDYYSCVMYLTKRRLDCQFLFALAPVIALDYWDASEARSQVDAFGKIRSTGIQEIHQVRGRLVPVPIAKPNAAGGYCSLPNPTRFTKDDQAAARAKMGIGEGTKAVLLCTGLWQHDVSDVDGQRIGKYVPQLLASLLEKADPGIVLVHVGPVRLQISAEGGLYRWFPSMMPVEFDRLLSAIDLVVSLNVAATTVGRAIAAETPTLVIRNSFSASTLDELEGRTPFPIGATVRGWLQNVFPLYAFSMWPLGYSAFLEPVLRDNEYSSAFETVELTDEAGLIEAVRRLLFDKNGRSHALTRQALYSSEVRRLPGATQIIDGYLD